MIKKFKTTAALQKAYEELEKAYTKKCQELSFARALTPHAPNISQGQRLSGEKSQNGTPASHLSPATHFEPLLAEIHLPCSRSKSCQGNLNDKVGDASLKGSAQPLGIIGSEDARADSMGSKEKVHNNVCDNLEQIHTNKENNLRNNVLCDSIETDSNETYGSKEYDSNEIQNCDSNEHYGSKETDSNEHDSNETDSNEHYCSKECDSNETQLTECDSIETDSNEHYGSIETQSCTSSDAGSEEGNMAERECTRVPVYLLPNFKQVALDFFEANPLACDFEKDVLALLVENEELAKCSNPLEMAAAAVVGRQVLTGDFAPQLVQNLTKADKIRDAVICAYLAALRSRPSAPPVVKAGASSAVIATPKRKFKTIREAGEALSGGIF